MDRQGTFAARVAAHLAQLTPTERDIVEFLQANREEALIASASALAAKIGTSDASVVRTAKTLGYAGLDDLRQALAAELRENLSPASRLVRTLGDAGGTMESAMAATLAVHVQTIERLRQDISPQMFEAAVDQLSQAQRILVFGLGPSSALADYFAIQLGRFGFDGGSLKHTGLLLADDLHRLKTGDVVVILAYGRVYGELDALLGRTRQLGIATLLLTDSLGEALRKRVDLILPVARGRADQLSMHTTTLSLIEALLVGLAARRPAETVASLELLNDLRAKLTGQPMDLPTAKAARASPSPAQPRTRRR